MALKSAFGAVLLWQTRAVPSSTVGQSCGNCYGEGQVPTDAGPAACPDCGGAGVLPTNNVLVEWRASEIERVHGMGQDQIAQDVRWLLFELRRGRAALTKLLALAEELGDDAPVAAVPFHRERSARALPDRRGELEAALMMSGPLSVCGRGQACEVRRPTYRCACESWCRSARKTFSQ